MRCMRLIAALAASLALGACVLSGDDTPLAIAGISPPNGSMGQTVAIEGDHFCPTPGGGDAGAGPCDSSGGLIRFGATAATTTQWTDSEIDDAVIPPIAPGATACCDHRRRQDVQHGELPGDPVTAAAGRSLRRESRCEPRCEPRREQRRE